VTVIVRPPADIKSIPRFKIHQRPLYNPHPAITEQVIENAITLREGVKKSKSSLPGRIWEGLLLNYSG
jgi:hypothetical protein